MPLTVNGFTCSLMYANNWKREIYPFRPKVYAEWNMAASWVPVESIVEQGAEDPRCPNRQSHSSSASTGFVIDFKESSPATQGYGCGWTVHMLRNGAPIVPARTLDAILKRADRGETVTVPLPYLQQQQQQVSVSSADGGVIEVIVMPHGRSPTPLVNLTRTGYEASGHIAHFKFGYAPLRVLEQSKDEATGLPNWVHSREILSDWAPITRKRPQARATLSVSTQQWRDQHHDPYYPYCGSSQMDDEPTPRQIYRAWCRTPE